MFNIRIMGKLDNENKLIKSELPLGSKLFNEGDSLQSAFIIGFLISLPLIMVVLISSIFRISIIAKTNSMNMKLFAISFIITMIIGIGLMYLHELIHAFCYPLHAVKEIWIYKRQGIYLAYSDAKVSKNRFIWINLAPNVILGIFPYIIWLLIADMLPTHITVCSAFLIWYMILGGIVDYYNVLNTIKQVPKNANVFNYGLHSYWIVEYKK